MTAVADPYIAAAADRIVTVTAAAMVAVLAAVYLVVLLEQRHSARQARPARGRRRAHGPAVKGPRRLDRYRDNLRDDATALVHAVSRRRREAAASRYQESVLEQRIHEGATR